MLLSDSFLESMVAELNGENTVGVTLVGSFARGEGGRFSDVDLRVYVCTGAPAEFNQYRFVDNRMVSTYTLTVEDECKNLRKPWKAIWAIPGLCQARILLDKDGSIARMIATANSVNWEDLQPAADEFASHDLCEMAEEVDKILDGLEKGNESKIVYAIWGLSEELAEILLVQRGVLIPTENSFIDLAQKTAGRDSNWSRQFRIMLGMDVPPASHCPYRTHGTAALRLYEETVALMKVVIRPEDWAVIGNTLENIIQAGY